MDRPSASTQARNPSRPPNRGPKRPAAHLEQILVPGGPGSLARRRHQPPRWRATGSRKGLHHRLQGLQPGGEAQAPGEHATNRMAGLQARPRGSPRRVVFASGSRGRRAGRPGRRAGPRGRRRGRRGGPRAGRRAGYAVGDYHGTADGGNGPPAASGCKRHVRLLPRRRPRSRPAPLGWECARWRLAGPRRGAPPRRTARPTGSPTRAQRLSCPARRLGEVGDVLLAEHHRQVLFVPRSSPISLSPRSEASNASSRRPGPLSKTAGPAP